MAEEKQKQPKRVDFDDPSVFFDESERLLAHGVLHTGEAVEMLSDGTVIVLNNYKDGIEDGIQREFYGDGMLRSEYKVVNGRVSGVSMEWHVDGQLARRKEHDEFGVQRKIERWDENGVLTGTMNTW